MACICTLKHTIKEYEDKTCTSLIHVCTCVYSSLCASTGEHACKCHIDITSCISTGIHGCACSHQNSLYFSSNSCKSNSHLCCCWINPILCKGIKFTSKENPYHYCNCDKYKNMCKRCNTYTLDKFINLWFMEINLYTNTLQWIPQEIMELIIFNILFFGKNKNIP